MRHRSPARGLGFLASKVARRRVLVAGIAALGASAAAIGSALPAGATATPTSTSQNSIIVGEGSATTYYMMQSLDTIFNQSSVEGCPLFESSVGQSSQLQQLDYSCATYSGTVANVTVTGGTDTVTVASGGFPNAHVGDTITGTNIVTSPVTTVSMISGNTLTMSQNASGVSTTVETLNFTGVFGALGGSTAPNPYNDAAVEEPQIGSSNGIAALEDAGGAFGTTGVRDYTGINFARSSRDPAGTDDSGLNFVAYAKDGVPWFHFTKVGGLPTPSAKVVSLTQGQLQAIYEGYSVAGGAAISMWNQVQIGTLKCAPASVIAVTGVSLNSTTTLTDSSGFPGTVAAGQFVVGTDIPSGTTVVNVSGTTLTMSAAATKTVASETVDFDTYNSSICTASSQIVPAYAVPQSNTSPIIVVAAQEGSGTQATFKTFLGADPTANNKVNCDPGLGTTGTPPVPTTCYGPLVILENELTEVVPLQSGSGGLWSSGQVNYLTPPSGSSLPWSTTQGGTGTMSQANLYSDMIFFYSYGKWTEQCVTDKDCGAVRPKLPSTDAEALGEVGGTASPGSGTHTGSNAAVFTAGIKPTEATILGSGTCTAEVVGNVTVNGTTTVTVASGGFPGVTTNNTVSGTDIASGTTVAAVSGNSLTLSQAATGTPANPEALTFGCPASTGDGRFPIARYLYNVYSNGTDGGFPEATAATINYVSEIGAFCRASDAYNVDPNTGNTYLSEYQAAIKNNGFYPLSAGATAGTVNTTPLDEGDVGGSADAYALLDAYATLHPGVQDQDFITPGTDQKYTATAWGSGQTNGTFTNATSGDPMGYCLVSTTGT